MYVIYEDIGLDYWQTRLLEIVGGKTHLRFQFFQFPLIPYNRSWTNIMACNVDKLLQADGKQNQNKNSCQNWIFMCAVTCVVSSRCEVDVKIHYPLI